MAIHMERKCEFEVVPITDLNQAEVVERVTPFHEQLKLAKGRTTIELVANVSPGAEAVFVVSREPKKQDIAVVVGRLITVPRGSDMIRIYLRYLRAVKEDHQQESIGSRLTDEIVERYCKEGIMLDGFEGRTPNPHIFRADELSSYIGTIHPIHKLHDVRTASLMALTLPDKYKEKLVDYETGLCEGVYPKGDPFRLFNLRRSSKRVHEIHTAMSTSPINARLANGDGIIYFEEVNKNPDGTPLKVDKIFIPSPFKRL